MLDQHIRNHPAKMLVFHLGFQLMFLFRCLEEIRSGLELAEALCLVVQSYLAWVTLWALAMEAFPLFLAILSELEWRRQPVNQGVMQVGDPSVNQSALSMEHSLVYHLGLGALQETAQQLVKKSGLTTLDGAYLLGPLLGVLQTSDVQLSLSLGPVKESQLELVLGRLLIRFLQVSLLVNPFLTIRLELPFQYNTRNQELSSWQWLVRWLACLWMVFLLERPYQLGLVQRVLLFLVLQLGCWLVEWLVGLSQWTGGRFHIRFHFEGMWLVAHLLEILLALVFHSEIPLATLLGYSSALMSRIHSPTSGLGCPHPETSWAGCLVLE